VTQRFHRSDGPFEAAAIARPSRRTRKGRSGRPRKRQANAPSRQPVGTTRSLDETALRARISQASAITWRYPTVVRAHTGPWAGFIWPYQAAVADAGFPADLGFPADVASADELLGGGLAVATRATRLDHPSRGRASCYSHTSTSRRPAIRRCTNSNAGLSKRIEQFP